MMKRSVLLLFSFLFFGISYSQSPGGWLVCNAAGCKAYYPDLMEEGVSLKWSGECRDGKAEGKGKLEFFFKGKENGYLEGEFKNGYLGGKGTYAHANGTLLVGNFINSMADGKGKFIFTNGGLYEGDIVNYNVYGKGVFKDTAGNTFTGFFLANKFYTGTSVDASGKTTYYQATKPVPEITERVSGYNPAIGVQLTEYFNEKWIRCRKEDASYYRIITYRAPNRPQGTVKDYYINGKMQSAFNAAYIDYDDDNRVFHEGLATWYYPSGKIKEERNYFLGKQHGSNILYYENGKIQVSANYRNDYYDGEYKAFYDNGKPSLVAVYKDNYVVNGYTSYDEKGNMTHVVSEDFLSHEDQWTSASAGSSWVTDDNHLALEVADKKATYRYNQLDLNTNDDFSIEATIRRTVGDDNTGYGLVFGAVNESTHLGIWIAETGFYKIYDKVYGTFSLISDWTESSVVKKGNQANVLKVERTGNKLSFSINGTLVKTIDYKEFLGKGCGLIAQSPGTYEMEKLVTQSAVGR